MAWQTDLVLMLRVLVNDYVEPQKHSDEYLRRVLVCAGILVRKDLELGIEYTFDIANSTITPDPIGSQDTVLQALLPLKAACMLNQGAYQTAVGQGIRVRDGDSQIDTTVGFKGYKDIIDLGPCASYAKLVWQLQASNGVGGAVLGPYRSPDDGYLQSIAYFYDEFAQSIGLARRRPTLFF